MNTTLTDKEILTDTLSSQKQIGTNYNSFAYECANTTIRDDFLNILRDEHEIETDLFFEMQKRGWYQVTTAPITEINTAKTKAQTLL